MMRAILSNLACSSVVFLAGCAAGGRPMTPSEVATHGTASYDASPAKVFVAAQGALKSEGYEIALADQGKGLIKTSRKLVRAEAVGGAGYAQAIAATRQYVVSIHADGAKTVVVAEPRVFMGDRDLSQESVWDIEGPMGERTLWTQLFRDVREAL
jgi:hypothetical protein